MKLSDFGISKELENSVGAWHAELVALAPLIAPGRHVHDDGGHFQVHEPRADAGAQVQVCGPAAAWPPLLRSLTRGGCSFSSDIWSLGIVLLECVAGVHPYTDCTTAVEVRAHATLPAAAAC